MAKTFMSMDGNTAAAYAAYAFTEVAALTQLLVKYDGRSN